MSKTIKRIEFTIIENEDSVETIRGFYNVSVYEAIGFLSMEVDKLRDVVFKSWKNEKEVKPDEPNTEPR